MPGRVSAVPLELLDMAPRTAGPDADVRVAGARLAALAPALAAATVAHAGRARELAHQAAGVGAAFLLAGGAAGALALAWWSAGGGPLADGAALVAAALGLDPRPGGRIERPGVDPRVVAAVAAMLGPAALDRLAATHPHLVGPVDGMPLAARYAANRRIALDAGLDDLAAPGRQLLYLDPVRGHVAEVLGDAARAEHVAVVVPGMGNELERFDVVLRKADALRAAAADLDPPADVATVAWLGYDSPTFDVVLDDAARAGGPPLQRLVDGLATTNTADATLTVVAHSYGSLVAGHAMRAGLDADAVAVTGSPGMGADRSADLGDAPVYALTAPLDAVAMTERFGVDPADTDFGATALATGAVFHSGYFDAGSTSLRNLALVAAGRPEEATRVEPSAFDRAFEVLDDVHHRVVGAPVDAAQAVVARVGGNGVEVANAVVDLAQRLTSPDFLGDALDDAWELVSR